MTDGRTEGAGGTAAGAGGAAAGAAIGFVGSDPARFEAALAQARAAAAPDAATTAPGTGDDGPGGPGGVARALLRWARRASPLGVAAGVLFTPSNAGWTTTEAPVEGRPDLLARLGGPTGELPRTVAVHERGQDGAPGDALLALERGFDDRLLAPRGSGAGEGVALGSLGSGGVRLDPAVLEALPPPRSAADAGADEPPGVGAAYVARTPEEADLAAVLAARGESAAGIARALDDLRARRTPAADGVAAPTGDLTPAEAAIVGEAAALLRSDAFAAIRAAHRSGRGEEAQARVGGLLLVYAPDIRPPDFAITLSRNQYHDTEGFAMGPFAFQSEEETMRTVLHELFRLRTGQSASGASGEQVGEQTRAAHAFNARALPALRRALGG